MVKTLFSISIHFYNFGHLARLSAEHMDLRKMFLKCIKIQQTFVSTGGQNINWTAVPFKKEE